MIDKVINKLRFYYGHDDLADFLSEESEYLFKMGIDLSKLVSCGGHGCVFELIDNKEYIAKITNDPREKRLFDLVYENPLLEKGFVKVKKMVSLSMKGRHFDETLTLIFKEKVKPLSSLNEWNSDIYKVLDEIDKYYEIQERNNFYFFHSNIIPSFSHNFFKCLELLSNNNIRVSDIGIQNLGLRGENLVAYDGVAYDK